MSNNVNPIVLRPVLGIVLAIDSVLLKMEQLCHGYSLVIMQLAFFLWRQLQLSIKQLRNVHQTLSL